MCRPGGPCAACARVCGGLCDRVRKLCNWKIKMAPSSDGVRQPRFWQAFVGELVGTMLFTLLGCGSWIETQQTAGTKVPKDVVRISLTFGFTYTVFVYVFRYISGGHLNPVVSICAAAVRKISLARALVYTVAQCVGAIIGAALIWGFTPYDHHDNLGATVPQPGVTQSQAFAVEFFGAMVFLFVITSLGDIVKGEDNPKAAHPFVIGLVLIVIELYAIPYTCGGLNPARSLGPAVVKNIWGDHWVYWFGPILGGLAGALLYDFVFSSNANFVRIKSCLLANEGPRKKPRGQDEATMAPEEVALRSRATPSPEDEEIELKVEGDASEKHSPQ